MAKGRTPIELTEIMRNVLAFGLVGSYVGAMLAFSFRAIPEANRDTITYMIGQLSGMATMALGFYFVNKVGQDALDATRSENTGKLADVAKAALDAGKPADEQLAEAEDETAGAAVDKAQIIKGEKK